MRVAPVNVFTRQNSGLQKQNTSFKMFENKRAGAEAARKLMEPDSGNRADSGFVKEDKRALVNFLDITPYVTVKHNDDITYIVANRESYAGHQNQDEFDDLFDRETRANRKMLKGFDEGKRFPAIREDLPALRRRLPEHEPDYLMSIYDNETRAELGRKTSASDDVSNLARKINDIDTDYRPVYRTSEPEYIQSDLERISELYGVR